MLLSAKVTDLPKDSVANASQIIALYRQCLSERVGKLPSKMLTLVMTGIDIVLGR